MPISAPTVGTRANANTGTPTSVAVDISGVPVGQVVFVVLSLGDSQASAVTPPAGWTIPSGGQGSEGTSGLASSRDVLLWHVKASGETTVTLSWPTGAKGTAQAITWPGAYPLAPVEAAAYLAHTSTGTFTSPSVTPTAATRWIAVAAHARSSTALRTFTPTAPLVERDDGGNSANPENAQELGDTNGTVTAAAHTYTTTLDAAATESHGGTLAWAIVPGSLGTAAGALGGLSGTAAGKVTVKGTASGALGALVGRAGGVVGVAWTVAPPEPKWRITAGTGRVSLLSNAPVRFHVFTDHAGLVYNPTGDVVQAAFMPGYAAPGPGDWHAATWDRSGTAGQYVAEINPGALGANLSVGTYYAWLRIIDASGTPVAACGVVIVT